LISTRLEKLDPGCYPVLARKIEGCPVPHRGTGRYTCKSKFNGNAPVVKIAPHSQEWLCHENGTERGNCKGKFNGDGWRSRFAGRPLQLQLQ